MALPLIPLSIAIATAGAGSTLGYFIVNTYEGKVMRTVEKKEETAQGPQKFPELYGFSKSMALDLIGRMRAYALEGLNPDNNTDLITMAKRARAELKLPDESGWNNRVLAFMTIVRDNIDPVDKDLYAYIRGGATDRDKTLNRTQNITKSVTSALPFYVRPGFLITAGVAVGSAYLLWPLIVKSRRRLKNA